MEKNTFRILGMAGSLRRQSYNRGLIRAAQQVAPPGVDIQTFDLALIPPYNADLEAAGLPDPVRELHDRIRSADALLIATPEYNYSIPGVLKNAIDWASRPPNTSPLKYKPVSIMGATPGQFGTVRAQLALRQVFVFTESYVLLKPEVLVFGAAERFNTDGNLTDETTRNWVRALVTALVDWTHRLKSP